MADANGAATADAEMDPAKLLKKQKKEAEKAEKLAKFQDKKKKQEQATQQNKEKEKEKEKKPESAGNQKIVYTKKTEHGEKKDISDPIPDSYSPEYVEAAWYDWWVKSGFFKPEYNSPDILAPNPNGKFVIVIPPPNVTGTLHIGHALTNSIQDSLVRWHRMRGATTLFIPGSDHAGIATQVVVEKKLMREQNKTRHDFGRENFIKEVWKWKEQKGHHIYEQLHKLGGSYDWDRVCFTMDPHMCKAVTEAFVRLHDEGIIYRSTRLVNWSCTLRSAISDIEVEKRELTGRTMLKVPGYSEPVEFGLLTEFAYRIVDANGKETGEDIVVATTRVETMLGDTAVAVHPEDERYKHLAGLFVQHPFQNRRLPIIFDAFVDKTFGTGAVKVTPAHDHTDYEVGKRQNLPFMVIFNDQGIVTEEAGPQFAGLKRFDARKAVYAALKERGFTRGEHDHAMIVPICSRSKDIIEPLMKPQWYIRCKEMAENAVAAVRNGELNILPSRFRDVWYRWLEQCTDWCISRQLWWGHRVPAYAVRIEGEPPCIDDSDGRYWVSGRTEKEALAKAAARFNVPESKIKLRHDEDVLDTWFSSGLFPFSVSHWPDNTPAIQAFYPTSLLETGHDILFFWVARMVFFGQKFMGKLPFRDVYLHPIVRDPFGRKMSKSLGNVVDPIDIMRGITLQGLNDQLMNSNLDPAEVEKAKEGQRQMYPNGIPECGADALRFTLLAYINQGQDLNLDVLRIQGYRFFCNKLWNAFKFTMNVLGADFKPKQDFLKKVDRTKLKPIDSWILSRFAAATRLANEAFGSYEFSNLTTAIYNFWWYELCDVYLESIKPIVYGSDNDQADIARQVLYACVHGGLRLLHPTMPFISEELFQRLPKLDSDAPSITVAKYPETEVYAQFLDVELDKCVTAMQEVVARIRQMRTDYNLARSAKPVVYIRCTDAEYSYRLAKMTGYVQTLGTCSQVEINGTESTDGCALGPISATCQVFMMLRGVIDAERELTRLNKRLGELKVTCKKLDEEQQSENFNKLPENVRQSKVEKLQQTRTEMVNLEQAVVGVQLMMN